MKNRKKPIIITLCSLVLCLSTVLGIMLCFPVQANAVELVTGVSNMSSGSGVLQPEDNTYVFGDGAKVHVVGWHGDWENYNKPWVMAADAWYNDSVYTYDATAGRWKTDNNMRWQNGEGLDHHFVAWSSADVAQSNQDLTAVEVTVTGDYEKDDILLARWSGKRPEDNNRLDLEFNHLMARLDVNLWFRSEYTEIENISVEMNNMQNTAVCNFLTGEVISTSGQATIKLQESPHLDPNYHWIGTCITVPQRYSSMNGITLKFTADGEEKTLTLQGSYVFNLRPSERYTLNFIVGDDKVELMDVTATDWADSSDDASEPGKQQMTDDFTLVLHVPGNREKIETHQMSFGDNGWNAVVSKFLPTFAFAYKGAGVTVYEYDQGWVYDVTLQQDQSTPEKLAAADVMIATSEAWSEIPLDLNLEHHFAKMTFKVRFGDEYAGNPPELTDIKFYDTSCFLNEENADNKKIEVICNPTWHAGSFPVLTFKVDGVPKELSLGGEGITAQAGVNYVYELKIGRDTVTLTPVSESTDFPGGWSTEVNLDGSTGTIGTADAGKTAWENGDKTLVHLHSNKYGDQSAVMTFDGTEWKPDGATLKYFEDENPTITAVYAPDCEIKSDETIGLIDGKQYGLSEYIPANTTVYEDTLGIRFESGRSYSRLRIVAEPFEQLTVTTTTGFTPAGTRDSTPKEYTLTADANGNAYLYGKFEPGNMVKVVGNVTVEHRFTAATVEGTSYVLDARARYVNLGLPSGTLWATYNVGANDPWDYGDYFAWGETSPKTSYTWDNYKWGTQDNLTKYNSADGITTLEAGDDAAFVNMGADWRMPTAEEWQELIDNCTWTWTTVNGMNGYTVTGSNGNSIFLPAAGTISGSSKLYANSQGLYWTDVMEHVNKTNPNDFCFTSSVKVVYSIGTPRYAGLTVRAVYDPAN